MPRDSTETEPAPARAILHADLDQFFAAVEVLDRPELRGQPVVVGADPRKGRGRGVVSTASYEARAFGVRSAMPISEAWRRCPQANFLPVRFARYEGVSARVMAIFSRYTPQVQPLSLDEAFLDVTGSRLLFGDGETIARRIVRDIYAEEGLVVSVGVASNKSVAKIASDVDKPHGLVVVPPGRETEFLEPLPIRRLWGVGPKTAEILEGLRVHKVGDLPRLGRAVLVRRLGAAWADHLLALALGMDPRPVTGPTRMQSVSHEITYARDVGDREAVEETLLELAEAVGRRARRVGAQGRTVQLRVRWEDFETIRRDDTRDYGTDGSRELYLRARDLFSAVWALGRGRRVRLVGVGLTRLGDGGDVVQMDIFGDAERVLRESSLDRAADHIRGRYGDSAIGPARLVRPAGRRRGPANDASGRPKD